MKKHFTIVTRAIHEIVCKIKSQKGHKHLYDDYQVLVDALQMSKNLSNIEIYRLDELINILLDEAQRYSRTYPKWSTRCLECASELFIFLPLEYKGKEEPAKKLAELLTSFITDPELRGYFPKNHYDKFIHEMSKNNVGMLGEMATNCFRETSAGRRPWRIREEITFHYMMFEGYQLANRYISLTGDFSHFQVWFSDINMNPRLTDSLIEQVSKWIDGDESVQNQRWNDYSYENVVDFFEHKLDMQLSLLWKWLDGDAEGFVNYWKAERIEELLELIEDNTFFEVLKKIHLLKNNQEVAKVLNFYAEDKEPHIRVFARKLLSEYQK